MPKPQLPVDVSLPSPSVDHSPKVIPRDLQKDWVSASLPMRVPVHSDKGPEPALPDEETSLNQWLATRMPTKSLGPYRQVIASLTIGNPNRKKETRTFPVEIDLGSSNMWVYGVVSKQGEYCPRGDPFSPAQFWSSMDSTTSQSYSESKYTIKYADGSFAHCKLFSDYVHLETHPPGCG